MKKLISLVLVAASISGCSTVPMDESKPVYFTRSFWQGPSFSQNGEVLDRTDAENKISKSPAAAEKLDSAAKWGWGALGVMTGGLIVALTAPHDSNNRSVDSGQYWLGLGIIVFGSLPFTLTANRRLEEAAEAYNNDRFTFTPKTKTSLYLSPLKDGGMAGLEIQF